MQSVSAQWGSLWPVLSAHVSCPGPAPILLAVLYLQTRFGASNRVFLKIEDCLLSSRIYGHPKHIPSTAYTQFERWSWVGQRAWMFSQYLQLFEHTASLILSLPCLCWEKSILYFRPNVFKSWRNFTFFHTLSCAILAHIYPTSLSICLK